MMLPEDVLPRIPGFAAARVEQRLESGPVSNNYKISCSNQQYVLRIDRPLAAELSLDRSRELKLLYRLSRQGLHPEPVYAAPDEGISLVPWVNGRQWSDTDLANPESLSRFARRLRIYHAVAVESDEGGLAQSITAYGRLADTSEGRALAREAGHLLDRIDTPESRYCFCHNDLHAGNIIEGEQLIFIDWEYGFAGDPFFDIAAFAHYQGLDADQTQRLLADYLQENPRPSHLVRLEKWGQLYDMVAVLWGLCVSRQGS